MTDRNPFGSKVFFFLFLFLFFFLAAPHGLWDWTWAPAMKAPRPNHWTTREFSGAKSFETDKDITSQDLWMKPAQEFWFGQRLMRLVWFVGFLFVCFLWPVSNLKGEYGKMFCAIEAWLKCDIFQFMKQTFITCLLQAKRCARCWDPKDTSHVLKVLKVYNQ